ncbi:MAG: hypothetical protein JXR46_11895 [Calditrichaceae bacterium]|nr:hypothetical protein [Calditrichaceae bacterium]
MRAFIFIILVFLLCSCKKSTSPLEQYTYSWPLRADSMNFAILGVNGETYELEGGYFAHHEKCTNCVGDSLPFDVTTILAHGFDLITFRYSYTMDTLFGAIVFLGGSNTNSGFSPELNLSPDKFKTVNHKVEKPQSIEYFGYYGIDETALSLKSDSVWNAVSKLDILNDFSQQNFQTGIFHFTKEPEWIVFLVQ